MLIIVLTFETLQSYLSTDICYTATCNNTFFYCCTSCTKCIIYTVFLLLHLHLRSSTYIQLGNTTCEFCQTLLQFLLIIGRFCGSNLRLDLSHTSSNILFSTCTIDDCCVILINSHALSCTQHVDSSGFEFDTFLLANHSASCENSNIFEHLFATVAKARSLHRTNLQLSTQTVDNQGSESLAIYILCNNKQRTTTLHSRFEHRQQLLQITDFLIIDEDIWAVHLHLHCLCVRYEIWADITTVELHTLYHINSSIHAFSFTDSNHTIFANHAHRISYEFANSSIVIIRNSSHLFNLIEVVAHLLALLFDVCHNSSHSLVHTTFEVHGVSPCCHILQTNRHNGLCEYSSSSCTITCLVTCFACNLFHKLCTQVLCGISQLNLFGYRHTIFGDMWSTELLINDYITSLRTKGNFHCVSQLINATFEGITRLNIITDILCHNSSLFQNC